MKEDKSGYKGGGRRKELIFSRTPLSVFLFALLGKDKKERIRIQEYEVADVWSVS
jgi:hypothetical protein